MLQTCLDVFMQILGDLLFSTLKQKVIILLARLFPLKSVCMESASSTSLENMFHSSW